eukprot:SAG22_NODE_12191_length_453_cov_0.858757_1_plen_52_part_10
MILLYECLLIIISGVFGVDLPGNGGILIAVGLMAGGWESGPRREAPGFPAAW